MPEDSDNEKLKAYVRLTRARLDEVENPKYATIEDIAIASATIGTVHQLFMEAAASSEAIGKVNECLALAASAEDYDEVFSHWRAALDSVLSTIDGGAV